MAAPQRSTRQKRSSRLEFQCNSNITATWFVETRFYALKAKLIDVLEGIYIPRCTVKTCSGWREQRERKGTYQWGWSLRSGGWPWECLARSWSEEQPWYSIQCVGVWQLRDKKLYSDLP